MRLFLGQAISGLRLAEAMDQRKIIIARLPKGLIGEDNANIVGRTTARPPLCWCVIEPGESW